MSNKNISRRQFTKLISIVVGFAAVSPFIPLNSLSAQVQYENPNGILVPQSWKEGRPYWDMPVDQDSQVLAKTKKTLEYQFNPFHQPNEIYGKETCHGGGSYDNSEIGQSDIDAAQAGIDHYALDVNGDNIINYTDATEIQNYLDNTTPHLQSHWNFLNKDEKLSWFTKMADIYTVDQKHYIDGDEDTRYISGNFATEFAIRMQGYNKELTDVLGGTRKDIPDKYNESLEINGRGNIPVYFVGVKDLLTNKGHGMNGVLIGDNPLEFNDWVWYEPQLNRIVEPELGGASMPFNSEVSIFKLENFGNSGWGEDMLSRYLLEDLANTMNMVVFNVDINGNTSKLWDNQNFLTTKPTVSIGNENNSSNPVGFYLAQNYPNPFNPSTTIQFDIPPACAEALADRLNPPYKGDNSVETRHALSLQLIVYDITGKEITTLINNINTSGFYQVKWNASGCPSGIYFYQLQSNSSIIATRKMLLMK
ncbi:MAG: T9SS type A sorting domain-containing protein [Planctomycetia bacterium]|nr:T9SS type A sorting domain-containing protein [Planctomycetia bacterium]